MHYCLFAAARFQAMASSVLRKGGGLSEALTVAAAAAGPAGGAQQQQQQQQEWLAGDWQGGDAELSDVELELLLAEFSYVEQVCWGWEWGWFFGFGVLGRYYGFRDAGLGFREASLTTWNRCVESVDVIVFLGF
jgi:hypothetical protein